MKKLLLLISFLFSLAATAQQYYPMLDSVNVWTYTGNQMPIVNQTIADFSCNYPFWTWGTNTMETGGDTVINSASYKILYWNTGGCVYGYMREDTSARRVYFMDVNSHPEILLYDFSMQVGNTINVNFLFSGYFQSGSYRLDSIVNINIYAGTRRAFYLSGPGFYPLIWIESVGNLGDVIYPYSSNTWGGLFQGFCSWFPHDFGYFVTCFDHNQKVYYDSCAWNWANGNPCFAYFDTCDYYNICGGINELNSSPFSISPNPAHDYFTITSKYELAASVLEIYNLFGQKVYSESINSKHQTVNCKLDAGAYFIRVQGRERNLVQKLIIE